MVRWQQEGKVHMNNSSRQYEYVMEGTEIREFCLAAWWEQCKCRKGVWLRLLLILTVEFFMIPKAAVLIVAMVVIMLLVSGVYNYKVTAGLLEGQPWKTRIAGDRLQVEKGDYSETPCRNIKFIRMTKHLLMLGYLQSAKRPVWFIVPLRVFGSKKEREMFLDRIRNPQGQAAAAYGDGMGNTAEDANMAGQEKEKTVSQEYMRFSYRLDAERWVRFQKGVAEILNSSSLGRPMRTYGVLVWGCVMAVTTIGCACVIAGNLHWLLVCYCLAVTVWLMLWIYYRDPEKSIRRQFKSPEVAAKACGIWQVSLSEEGITVNMPMEMKSFYPWRSLRWLVEKEEAFYLLHQDKRHYIMIAKDSFLSRDQVDAFLRICAQQGMQKTAAKKAYYMPGWLMGVLFGLIMAVSMVVFLVKIYLDVR